MNSPVQHTQTYAPVALFVYGRADHTRKTLDALRDNTQARLSDLFIYSDGAKNEAARQNVAAVRDLIRNVGGFKSVTVIEREVNLGLAKSIVDGVTTLCARYGRVIVVEDDLLTSTQFLAYMNLCLDRYAENEKVFQVAAYNLCGQLSGNDDAFFMPFCSSWGWGTWSRAWRAWNENGDGFELLEKDKQLRHRFDLNGSYPYFQMLLDQRQNRNNSWAIRWYLSVFLAQGLVLYPRKSLVENIGFDGSGEHCGIEESSTSRSHDYLPSKLPIEPETSLTDFEQTCRFLLQKSRSARPGPYSVIRRALKWLKN